MKDRQVTKEQLLIELEALRKKNASLLEAENKWELTEKALRESEKKYRTIFTQSRDANYITTPEDGAVEFNQAALDLFGYSAEEFKTLDISDLYVDPADRSRLQAVLKEKGFVRDEEIRLRRRDGSEIICLDTASVWWNDDGSVKAYIGSLRDITVRKRTLKALKESEEKYRSIFENAAEGIFQIKTNGRFINVNQKLADILGFKTPEEFLSSVTDVRNQLFVDSGQYDEILLELREQKIVTGFEVRLHRRDGITIWCAVSVRAVKDAEDRDVRYEGFLVDINAQKLAQAELERSLSLLRATFEAVPDGIMASDLDRNVVDLNEKFAEIWRMPAAEYKRLDIGARKAHLRPLLKRPKAHEARLQELQRSPNHDTYDIIELKDGRVFERFTHPQRIGGRTVGLVWTYRDITERKRNEESLAWAKERAEQIYKVVPSALFTVDEKRRITSWNDKAAEITGYSASEAIGQECMLFVANSCKGVCDLFTEDVIKPLMGKECTIRRKDGRLRIIAKNSDLLKDSDGKVIGGIESFEDITERKKSEEALKESEARFARFTDHMPALAFMKEPGGRYIFTNKAYKTILDLEPEDRIGKTDYELWPADIAAVLQENDRRVLREGATIEVIETVEDAEGRERLQLTYKFPIFREGKPGIVGGVALDITDRIQAEEALKESEERHRTVLDASPDPIVVFDTQFKTLYFNRAFNKVFGWTIEELSDRMADYVPEENRGGVLERIEMIKRGEDFSDFETRFLNREGETLDINMSAAVWRDGHGAPAGSVIVLHDVTEQKKTQAQLRQAQKMEAVGTLAGGVAHDFNNVLQTISGYVQLLLMKNKKNDSDYEYLNSIDQSVQSASDLVKQLLTISRKWESKLEPVDINREVVKICKLLERSIPKMIGIKMHLTDGLAMVNADPVQLEQIILNLAGNAKDAMPDGGELVCETKGVVLDRVFCRLHPEVTPGEYVLLRVSDTGSGMDRETLEHIFEPFFSTKDIGQGSGLGLSTVYSIVRNHYGLITCYSEPGRGTAFNIYLPVLAEAEKINKIMIENREELRGGRETVLLVDDEESILEVGREILAQYGYKVLSAVSGEESIKIFKQRAGQIDLVILDLGMPGMGGHKCLEELIKLDPSLKVIVASGYANKGHANRSLESGAKGFISKPYRLENMLAKVRAVLDD